MRKNILFLLFIISLTSAGQDYLGFVNSNYAGITGAQINPANIVDSRMRVDVNLAGLNFNIANNYIGIKREALTNPRNLKTSDFQKEYLTDVNNGTDKSVFFSSRISLPSFMISLGTKNAIGFSVNSRTYVNIDGVSEALAKLLYSDMGRNTAYNVQDLLGINIKNKYFSANAMTWMEYGVTFAHVFKSNNQHFFKAGITPKYLLGFAS